MLPNHLILQHTKIYSLFLLLLISAIKVEAQFNISGHVYDSSRSIPVPNVIVKSSNGKFTLTDSTGAYEIIASDKDSLIFMYNNKPTAKFAVKQIPNIGSFDIALHIRMTERVKTMKEVRVYTRTYRQDSIDNRQTYAKIFNYQKPGIKTNTSSYSGAAGMDLDEFINIFRFSRNKHLHYMQNRLMEQEQENYVNYRFNKLLVRRITRLEGTDLDTFMIQYRPNFEFTQSASTIEFYQYILNASYQFKREKLSHK